MASPLSPEQAHAFARMMHAGAPPEEAAKYFCDPLIAREDLREATACWTQQPEVMEAYDALRGGKRFETFEDRDERLRFALDKHYDEQAFTLYANNYAEAEGTLRTKMDTCRESLEKKLAGTAGRDPIVEFWQDLLRTKKREAADSEEVSLQ